VEAVFSDLMILFVDYSRGCILIHYNCPYARGGRIIRILGRHVIYTLKLAATVGWVDMGITSTKDKRTSVVSLAKVRRNSQIKLTWVNRPLSQRSILLWVIYYVFKGLTTFFFQSVAFMGVGT
jgi:hypothetical protein